jgi:predicted RNA-binding protein
MLDNLSKVSLFDSEISNDELELFTRCFKSYIGVKRNQFRKIVAMIQRDKITSKKLIPDFL